MRWLVSTGSRLGLRSRLQWGPTSTRQGDLLGVLSLESAYGWLQPLSGTILRTGLAAALIASSGPTYTPHVEAAPPQETYGWQQPFSEPRRARRDPVAVRDTLGERSSPDFRITGAVLTKVGSFGTGTGAAATQIPVSGLNFTPKAIIFWWNGRTEIVDAVGVRDVFHGIGFATSPSQRNCCLTMNENGAATSDTDRGHRTDACVAISTVANAIDGLLDLVSFDEDGFTLVVDDQFSADFQINYLALGGDSLTNVIASNFSGLAAPGSQDVTGVGFQPTSVLMTTIGTSTAPPALLANQLMSIGAATALNQAVLGWDAVDNQAAQLSRGTCSDGNTVINPAPTGRRAVFTGFLSDGFQLNWQETGSAAVVMYLAIEGINVNIGSLQTRTDSADITITGLGFQPKALMFFSRSTTEDASGVFSAGSKTSVGAVDDRYTRVTASFNIINAADPTQNSTAVEYDAVYANINNSATIEGLMDLKSIDTDGFTCVMDDPDPSASFVWYLAIGEAAEPALPGSWFGTFSEPRRSKPNPVAVRDSSGEKSSPNWRVIVSGKVLSAVGSFNTGTDAPGATVQIYTGFEPKAILFWWSGATGVVDVVSRSNVNMGYGLAVSPSSRCCVGAYKTDNVVSAVERGRLHHNAAVVAVATPSGVAGAGTFAGLLDLQSMDADGFTLVVDDGFPMDIRVHYLALSGDDLTNAVIGQFSPPGSAVQQDITSAGFRPDTLMFLAGGPPTDPPAVDNNTARPEVAVAVSTTQEWTMRPSLSSATSFTTQTDQRCLWLLASNEAEFVSFLSNGFRINWVANNNTTSDLFYLALKGVASASGSFQTRTDTDPISITGLGFQPEAVFFGSLGTNTIGDVQQPVSWSIGAVDQELNQRAAGYSDQNTVSPREMATASENDEVYISIDSASSVDGLMRAASLDSDGFTLEMSDPDPGATLVWYFAIGEIVELTLDKWYSNWPDFARPKRPRLPGAFAFDPFPQIQIDWFERTPDYAYAHRPRQQGWFAFQPRPQIQIDWFERTPDYARPKSPLNVGSFPYYHFHSEPIIQIDWFDGWPDFARTSPPREQGWFAFQPRPEIDIGWWRPLDDPTRRIPRAHPGTPYWEMHPEPIIEIDWFMRGPDFAKSKRPRLPGVFAFDPFPQIKIDWFERTPDYARGHKPLNVGSYPYYQFNPEPIIPSYGWFVRWSDFAKKRDPNPVGTHPYFYFWPVPIIPSYDWFDGWEDFAKRKPGLRTAQQEFFSFWPEPIPDIVSIGWFAGWDDFTRSRRTIDAAAQQYQAFWPYPIAVQIDWFERTPDYARGRPPLATGSYPFFSFWPEPIIPSFGWYSGWDDFARPMAGLPTGLNPYESFVPIDVSFVFRRIVSVWKF